MPRRRSTNKRSYRRTLYAVLEGEKTEDEYIRFLKDCLPGNHGVNIIAESPGSARRTLFDRAKRIAQEVDDDSEVWIVCDVEDEGEVLRDLTRQRFQGSHRLRWAVSNPAFALWLVMHVDTCTRWEHRDTFARAAVRLGIAIGNKGKGIDRSALVGRSHVAQKNAATARRAHASAGNGIPDNNPQSDVDQLVQRVIDLYNEHIPEGSSPLEFSTLY